MGRGPGGTPPLLGEASREDAARPRRKDTGRKDTGREEAVRPTHCSGIDLGDVVVLLLAGTLAGLRDRLDRDGFDRAAELVADLVEIADDYVTAVGV